MAVAAEMSCPVCDVVLMMSDRQGVEIDYCPQCRGVWLDRGELDKIIERTNAEIAPPPPPRPPQVEPQAGYTPQGYGHQPQGYGEGHPDKKRKKSFLDELFD